MQKIRWKAQFTIILLFVSIVLYLIHFVIFDEPRFIFKLLINNLAFAPISVLFLTLFINQILEMRTKQEQTQKTYLALGTFFHEIGNELLRKMAIFDISGGEIQDLVAVDDSWDKNNFARVRKNISLRKVCLACNRNNLKELRDFLNDHRDYIIGMLANPALKEHEALTDMLWSVYHLSMELSARETLESSHEEDLEHLRVDAERAYGLLCIEWLEYMKHLKEEYPYLYSFALRTNPFKEHNQVELR